MSGRRRRHARGLLASALFFACFFALFFAPALLPGDSLAPGDGFIFYQPAHWAPSTAWSEAIGAGYPAYADPQFFLHYPLKWLFRDFEAFVIAAYVLAATFTFGYVRWRTRSTPAGLAAGLVVSTGSFMMLHLGHTSIIHAAAWVPAILWAGDAAFRRPGALPIVALVLASALVVSAGHPQIALYAFAAAGARALWLAIASARRRGARQAATRFAQVASSWLLGIALAAATIIPFVAAGIGSSRAASWGYGDFVSYSLPWRQAATLAFPQLFGGPGAGIGYFGIVNQTEVTAFAGLGAWVLALLGAWRMRRRDGVFWLLLIAAAWTLITVGDHPLGPLLYRVPLLSDFRAHGRAALLLILAVAVLIGEGIAHLQRAGGGLRIASAATFAVASAALVATFADPGWRALVMERGGAPLTFAARSAVGPFLTLALVTTAAAFWRRQPGRAAAAALLIAVAVDVGHFGAQAEWRDAAQPEPLEGAWAALAAEIRAGGGRLMPLGSLQYVDHPLVPNANLMAGVPSTAAYGPLQDDVFQRATGMATDGTLPGTPSQALQDALAVTHLTFPTSVSWGERVGTCDGLASSRRFTFTLPEAIDVAALRVTSHLACSLTVADGVEVGRFTLHGSDGTADTVLMAGRHTAEWAYDRADVRGRVPHARGSEADTLTMGGEGIRYRATLPIARSSVTGGEIVVTAPEGAVVAIEGVTLIGDDGRERHTIATSDVIHPDLPPFVPITAEVAVARRGVAPTAWFASDVTPLSIAAAAEATRTGLLPDGAPFDPFERALVPPGSAPAGPRATGVVHATTIGRDRAAIDVTSFGEGWLVASRAYHPGWRAFVDGVPVRIVRTTAILTGIPIPPGRHQVVLEFAPTDLRIGRGVSLAALCVLLALGLRGALSASGSDRARRADRRPGS